MDPNPNEWRQSVLKQMDSTTEYCEYPYIVDMVGTSIRHESFLKDAHQDNTLWTFVKIPSTFLLLIKKISGE